MTKISQDIPTYSAFKERELAREDSHLSVPRVLEDSIPGTAFCLGNVTVVFTAIPPTLPGGSSMRMEKKPCYQLSDTPSALLLKGHKGKLDE